MKIPQNPYRTYNLNPNTDCNDKLLTNTILKNLPVETSVFFVCLNETIE